MSVIQFPEGGRQEALKDHEVQDVQDVVPFPSEPRPVVPRLEGLTTREEQAVVAWCAANEILELTPVIGTSENGARCVGIEDSTGDLKWTVGRERGSLFVIDCHGEAVPRMTSRAVESLWQALTREG